MWESTIGNCPVELIFRLLRSFFILLCYVLGLLSDVGY
jgi:hypothetical protein